MATTVRLIELSCFANNGCMIASENFRLLKEFKSKHTSSQFWSGPMPSLFHGKNAAVFMNFRCSSYSRVRTRHQPWGTESLAIIIHIQNAQVQKSINSENEGISPRFDVRSSFWTSSNCQRWRQPATGARSSYGQNERLCPQVLLCEGSAHFKATGARLG